MYLYLAISTFLVNIIPLFEPTIMPMTQVKRKKPGVQKLINPRGDTKGRCVRCHMREGIAANGKDWKGNNHSRRNFYKAKHYPQAFNGYI